MTQILDSDVDAFRFRFSGRLTRPGDPGYDEARSIFNGAIDRRPAMVAECSSAVQVAEAIGFARGRGMEISVRGGGHGLAGTAVASQGLMISLSGMRQVSVDPESRRAVCGGGATWADVDAATQARGLAVPGGVVSHTGIGGLTLGGGMGWLAGKAGLSLDNLVSAEVVTADGRILRASAGENPDLFWAVRGGGGNFGVVTSFEYCLHEVGPLVYVGLFFWGLDRGTDALRFCRDFVKTLPEDMGVAVVGLNAPPASFVPERHHFAPGYVLLLAGFGTAEEHEEAVEPVRERARPLFELLTPMPYTNLQQLLDGAAPWGVMSYEKGIYLDELTDDVIRVFAEHFPRKSSPLSVVPMQLFRGAYARVGEEETAFGGRRKETWSVSIAGQVPEAALLEAERGWVRAFWEALRPYSRHATGYMNHMSEYEDDRVRATFGSAKYDRLARIKAVYDPDNVFHHNANIKPAC